MFVRCSKSASESGAAVREDSDAEQMRLALHNVRDRAPVRITGLRTAVVHMPFDPPIGGGLHRLLSSDCVLVFLDTDAGLTGQGLVFCINRSRLEVLHAMVQSLAPVVIGLDPEFGGVLAARWRKELNFVGEAGVSVMGLAGVEEALWDLRGKAAGLNVSRLVGACAAAVPIYNSGGLWIDRSIDQLQEEAGRFVQQGWRAMKMRLGSPDPRTDVARVRAVREAVGWEVAIMADLNQQFTVPRAIRLGRMLEEWGLAWLEEPVAYRDHEGEAAIAAALDTPIASGETEYTSRGMLQMLQHRSVDILMPDLQRMGGPSELLKAAHLAEAFDKPVVSHLFPEMNLSLFATMPNAMFLEYMPWTSGVYREQIELDAEGRAIVPDRPGWGFSFDPDAVRRLAA